jgi:hypothetical protein
VSISFAHGCNYPWSTDGHTVFYGLDFGANVWGSHLGVSTRRAGIERDFDEMAALGLNFVRWFVFCDGRAGIVYDDRDLPSGLDPHFFGDLDAALEIAAARGIALDLVLLDHPWMFSGVRATLADPVTGGALEARLPRGRAHVLATEAGRRALFAHVIDPLVTRYGAAGERGDLANAVCAYELMNEPDFVIEEWEKDLSRHVAAPLPFEVMAGLVTRLSEVVHARSRALATLGCARARNLWAWEDAALGLDVLQVHTYPDTRHPDGIWTSTVCRRPASASPAMCSSASFPAMPRGSRRRARRRRRGRSTTTSSSRSSGATPARGPGASAAPTATAGCRTNRCCSSPAVTRAS